MKIERDQVDFLSGVRHGHTLGSPVALRIENRDWRGCASRCEILIHASKGVGTVEAFVAAAQFIGETVRARSSAPVSSSYG